MQNSLFIKDKLRQLQLGYPTVSDKYNVKGGMLTGKDTGEFGDILIYSGVTGYYELAKTNGLNSVDDIAGILLATNVKLATYGKNEVITEQNEGINVFLDGYIALKVRTNKANILEGKKLAIDLRNGELRTQEDADEIEIVTLQNYILSGISEEIETGIYIVEVNVK